ncbi:MAG: ATP-binding protein [Candidatus Omnitrophica bacterium]|nr:ATP-binding protein [Candidatus Omnitrophota bacterium]
MLAFGWREHLIQRFQENWWLAPLVSSTVLATIGPFIYLFIQQKAEARLFREQRKYQSTLRQASSGMSRIKDLRRLMSMIVHLVNRTVRLEHTCIYLFDRPSENYLLGATRSRRLGFKTEKKVDKDSPLIEYLLKHRDPVVHEEIYQQAKDYNDRKLESVHKEMERINASVVIPSMVENKLLSLIVLGSKFTNKSFSDDDLNVFSILANQAALAIENAQFYEDMRQTHEQLFKAEKMATIGTMADGLSHQINNRLHALGFIAGDVLDSIRMKKKEGPLPPEIKDLVIDIEHGLNRIQENVTQGGEIVQGILKYTRKGEEGFAHVDLDQLLDAVIEMTQFKIKPGDMVVLRHFNGSVPKIKGNFTQLQEVFFNLIDNAYDAMMQRKEEFKEPGFKPTIKISVPHTDNDHLNILLEDNGIGIKDDDKKKIFTPFFTTKLSSKKGTGLGLYVIQKLIEENHHGRVSYESKYRQGTRVMVQLETWASSK